MSESDGVHEMMHGALRVALTVGGQAGQQIAQMMADRARAHGLASEQRARELQSRFRSEVGAARGELAAVHRQEWWDSASPEQIARAWQTARAWREIDPEIDRSGEVIVEQVRARHGVDALNPQADQVAVVDALLESQHTESARLREAVGRQSDYELAREWARENDPALLHQHEMDLMGSDTADGALVCRKDFVQQCKDRTGPDGEQLHDAHQGQAAAYLDEANAAAILAEPVPVSPASQLAAESDAEVLYDSAERRAQLSARLREHALDPDVCEARVLSDIAQGAPSRDAVKPAKKAPKARRSHGGAKQQDRSRGR